MKSKKFFIIVIVLLLCAMLVLTFMKIFNKNEEIAEITPGEEMTEEQERQTIISLYYINNETNTLVPEARVIDAKELLESPYKVLVEYLSNKPRSENLKNSIPEGTKVNNVGLSGDIVTIDLSKEFIENQEEKSIELAINAIVNTLTELNEVNSIKILIDGEERNEVTGTNINLSESFARKA